MAERALLKPYAFRAAFAKCNLSEIRSGLAERSDRSSEKLCRTQSKKDPGFAGPGLDSSHRRRNGRRVLLQLFGYCTVTDTVVVTGVAPDAVPVIVMVNVVAEAFRLALTFKVDFPFGVTEAGLSDTVTFRAWPEANNATGAAAPLTRAIESVSDVLLPRPTVIDVFAGVMVNTGGGAGTVTVRVVLSTMVPEVPFTVMV